MAKAEMGKADRKGLVEGAEVLAVGLAEAAVESCWVIRRGGAREGLAVSF